MDRIHALINYAALDEECLKAPAAAREAGGLASEVAPADLDVNFITTRLNVVFRVPKVDMRKPKEIPNFVR